MTVVIPEIGISYELEYYEHYKAGIRVTFNTSDQKFYVKADSRIPAKDINAFMISKASLFKRWVDKVEEKTVLKLPSDSNTAAFKNRLLVRCESLMRDYQGPRAITYKVSRSKSYWGRCSADKVISISSYCALITDEQLFYVLMHEHAHLLHMHHQPQFWNLVEMYCPDYKRLREELKHYSLS